jgi:hypothetical protein
MSPNPEGLETGVEVLPASNAEVVAGSLQRNLSDMLKALEDNPDAEHLFGKIILDFIPIAGGVQKVVEARAMVSGIDLNEMSSENEAVVQKARELCLIGMVEIILDGVALGATFGTSALVPDELFTVINRLNMLIKAQGKGEKLGGKWGELLGKLDFVGKIAHFLLKSEKITVVTDKALTVRNGRLGEWQRQLPPPKN